MKDNEVLASTKEVAKLLEVSDRRVRQLLDKERILGAKKIGGVWIIPLYGGMPVIERRHKGPKARWVAKAEQRPPLMCIHVNQHFLRYNANHLDEEPVPIFAIEKEGDPKNKVYSKTVVFHGLSKLVHKPDPKCGLKCGAKAWIQTYEPLELSNVTTHAAILAELASR